jgi:hypothetical protein
MANCLITEGSPFLSFFFQLRHGWPRQGTYICGFKHVESHGIFWRNCLRDHNGQWVTGIFLAVAGGTWLDWREHSQENPEKTQNNDEKNSRFAPKSI